MIAGISASRPNRSFVSDGCAAAQLRRFASVRAALVFLIIGASGIVSGVRAESSSGASLRTFDSVEMPQANLYETKDWSASYPLSVSSAKSQAPRFQMSVPKSWKFDTRHAFVRANSSKIGEFSPAVIKLREGQRCFDNASLSGMKRAHFRGQPPEGAKLRGYLSEGSGDDSDYRYMYCVQNRQFAVVMTFYSKRPNPRLEAELDRVVSSVRFAS